LGIRHHCAWLLLALGAVLLLAVHSLGASLATPQGPFLRSHYIAGPLPFSSDSKQWGQASPLMLTLSGQVLNEPFLAHPSVDSLTVRSLHNGHDIAFLVEWPDSTKNHRLTPNTFRDAVAMAFPLDHNTALACMGRADSHVNIWHWKADWQADLDYEESLDDVRSKECKDDGVPKACIPLLRVRRVSSVEELVAAGLSSFISKRTQGLIQGSGNWEEEQWRVVIKRAMLTRDPASDVAFHSGQTYAVSFAVWNGEAGERGGQKAVGPWVRLTLDPASGPSSPTQPEQTDSSSKSRVAK